MKHYESLLHPPCEGMKGVGLNAREEFLTLLRLEYTSLGYREGEQPPVPVYLKKIRKRLLWYYGTEKSIKDNLPSNCSKVSYKECFSSFN